MLNVLHHAKMQRFWKAMAVEHIGTIIDGLYNRNTIRKTEIKINTVLLWKSLLTFYMRNT